MTPRYVDPDPWWHRWALAFGVVMLIVVVVEVLFLVGLEVAAWLQAERWWPW